MRAIGGLRSLLAVKECVVCHEGIPVTRRGFLVNVCSDTCDAEEQADRPF